MANVNIPDGDEVTFDPDGDISATNVQAAIVEVRDDADTKLAAKADSGDLTTHTGDTANPHATDVGNLGSGTLAELNAAITDATLDTSSAARTPTSHASSHERDGSDEIDGDHLDIDFTPSNYTPTTSPAEADNVDDLAAHLAGIDTALGGGGAGGDVVGPASATDNAVTRFDSTTGKLVQDSGVTIDDSDNVAGVGNLTLSGTVDGRDVAADGTKLDGIESGADVTDAGNVAAAGALMTSGGAMTGAITTSSTFDGRDVGADGTKLDGIEAAADVTDTANVTAAGALMRTGGAMTGAITTSSTFDGRDVSADGAALDAHVADTANPHGTDIGNLGSGTLAELNTAVTDATLDDAGDSRPPSAHASDHISTGSDPIPGAVASGASGLLTGADKAKLDGIESGATADQSAAEVSFTANGDIAATDVQAAIVEVRDDTDTKLSGKADTAHGASHIQGGAAEVDGDQIDIDFTPSNYTPSTSPAEVTSVDHLSAHLAGIDDALSGGGGVSGPGSSTDNAVVRFDGTGGSTLQNSGVLIDDSNNITGVGNITLSGTVDGVEVDTHAARHERGGADEIDGDHLDIDYTPTNYTPSTTPSEAANVDDLAAHLAGIDDALGSAGGASISAISGMDSGQYYSSASGSGEIAALGADFTIACLCAPDSDGAGFDRRYVCGTRDGDYGTTSGGGIGFGFLYGRVFGVFITLVDGGTHYGVESNWANQANTGTITFQQQKWHLFVVIKSGTTLTFYCNRAFVEQFTVGSGAIDTGGTWTIGATDQGATGNGLDNGWVNGAAYVDSALTEDEHIQLYRDCVEDGQLADITGSWTRGHRVGGSDPGATWTPFSGTGNLSETSTVDYEGAISNPQWR